MSDKIETRGAPIGSTNAKKEVKAESNVVFRCLRSDKAKWVKQGQSAGGLSAWIIKTLNAEIEKAS